MRERTRQMFVWRGTLEPNYMWMECVALGTCIMWLITIMCIREQMQPHHPLKTILAGLINKYAHQYRQSWEMLHEPILRTRFARIVRIQMPFNSCLRLNLNQTKALSNYSRKWNCNWNDALHVGMCCNTNVLRDCVMGPVYNFDYLHLC